MPADDVERFCALEHPRLVKAMTVYTADPELAAELAQEALARAHRDWARVRLLDSPGGWAHRTAVNLANSHFRRARLERRVRPRLADVHTVPPPRVADSGILRAAARLPLRQREALALRFLLDLSVEQTATRMGCAVGTVRALTAQAVARLRAMPELAHLKEPVDD